ncbi:MAG: T9SS type A sorting domain-containing protein, partial [bacterium]
ADLDGDMDVEDQIIIFDAKPGNYTVKVVPEPDADPADTYSLLFVADGDTSILAQDEKIEDIPQNDYSVKYDVPTSVSASRLDESIPQEFELLQNYPNPFNPATTIRFALPERGRVTLKIYNLLGQEVRTLLDENMTAGYHSVMWNGDDSSGRPVSSAVYIYRLSAGQFSQSGKLLVLR